MEAKKYHGELFTGKAKLEPSEHLELLRIVKKIYDQGEKIEVRNTEIPPATCRQ